MDYYVGLTDLSDALEALPMELIRHFTLLKEIDAKCLTTRPLLATLIKRFLEMPYSASEPCPDHVRADREHVMSQIRALVRELMPCLEEKMHVAGVAAEAVARHVTRIDYDFNVIEKYEIPELVRYGPPDHPAIVSDAKSSELARSAQSTRSETRREAIAARKAAKGQEEVEKRRGDKRRKDKDASGVSGGSGGSGVSGVSGMSGVSGAPGVSAGLDNSGFVGSLKKTEQAADVGVSGSNEIAGNNADVLNLQGAADSAASGQGTPADPGQRGQSGHVGGSAQNTGAESRRAFKREPDHGIARYADAEENHGAAGAGWGFDDHADKSVRQRVRRGGSLRPKDAGQRLDEPVYCYCQQVSFGEMVGCDGPECKREWFHLDCLGLSSPPKGSWFCQECSRRARRR